MLAQRLRHWPVIETALGDCLVFAGTGALLSRRHFPPPVARKATTQITPYIGPMLM